MLEALLIGCVRVRVLQLGVLYGVSEGVFVSSLSLPCLSPLAIHRIAPSPPLAWSPRRSCPDSSSRACDGGVSVVVRFVVVRFVVSCCMLGYLSQV